VNYATGGLGTAMHLNCELLAQKAGIRLQVVPYANVSAIGSDFMSNRVQMMCVPIPSAMQFLSAGKAIPLGVTSASELSEPFRAPSIRQSSGVDLVTTNWNGVLAPAKTPAPVMEKLAKAMQETLADPEVQQKLKDQGMYVNRRFLRDFDEYLRKESELWGPVVKGTGLKLD
jgi:tripartite-type tricarboxylate transporter receptor subunit TctC